MRAITSSGFFSWSLRGLLCALVAAALVAPAAAAPQAVKILTGPTLESESVLTGEQVKVTTSAVAINEEWVAFKYDWGDGTDTGNASIGFRKNLTETVSHTYTAPGEFTIRVTAYHGWKSGQPGVGAFKLRQMRSVTVTVLPKLPFTVGILTINADNAEKEGDKKSKKLKISGNVTINEWIGIQNSITVDTEKKTVTFNGPLGIPAAGPFAETLAAASDVTIDANTGAFVSAGIPSLNASFDVAGLTVKIEKVTIVPTGVQFDLSVTLPRLKTGRVSPCDATADPTTAAEPGQLVAITLKKAFVTTEIPHFQVLNGVSASFKNVELPGTTWGLGELTLGYETDPKEKVFGTLQLCLPSKKAIGGTIEVVNGEIEKLGFSVGVSIPIYTFTGVADTINITSMSAVASGLSAGGTPTIGAGSFDPKTGVISQAGISLDWNVGIPLLGLTAAPIQLNGAATFDALFNISVGGDIILFGKPEFRVASARGQYKYRKTGGVWTLDGNINVLQLVSLDGKAVTSFSPADAYFKARAKGKVGVPKKHWAAGILSKIGSLPEVDGAALLYIRATPLEKHIAAARGSFVVLGRPRVMEYQYNLKTGESKFTLDRDILKEVVTGKAASAGETLSGGEGTDGLIVELVHEAAAADFNLRLPDGTLLTPAAHDNIDVIYAQNPDIPSSLYFLRTAADGQYNAEFDDAGLGNWTVSYSAPRPEPTIAPGVQNGPLDISQYEEFATGLGLGGFDPAATVRVYLDDDTEWGGGVLVATGTAADAQLSGVPGAAAEPGVYNVMVEVEDGERTPEHAYAAETVTVRDYLTIGSLKGSIIDSVKPGKDKIKLKGAFAFDGNPPAQLFDHTAEDLDLALGDATNPFRLEIPAGDPGWTANPKGVLSWKSTKGLLPKIKIKIDPNKGKFLVAISKTGIAPQAGDLGLDLVFGTDTATLRGPATESKPGKFKLKLVGP